MAPVVILSDPPLTRRESLERERAESSSLLRGVIFGLAFEACCLIPIVGFLYMAGVVSF